MNGAVYYPNSNKYTKEGYVFLGWSENPDAYEAAYRDCESFTPIKDMTLYALWALESEAYTVTFDINGGNEYFAEPAFLATRKGSSIILPSLEFYKHLSLVSKGYSEIKDDEANYLSAGEYYTPEKNTTLYLLWGDGSSKEYASSKRFISSIEINDNDWVNPYGTNMVLKEKGKSNWYDIYQNYDYLCWAAASSNIFLWWYNQNKVYVDRYMADNKYSGPAFTYDEKGISSLYEYYKGYWDNIGTNPIAALHWFLQGSSTRPGGGFFADVYANKTYTTTQVFISKGHFNHVLTDVIKNRKYLYFKLQLMEHML